MGAFIESLREDRKKLVMVVGAVLLLAVGGVVGFVALSGNGDEAADGEIVFEFDDPPADGSGGGGGLSVEEQVALTVEASVPTPTPTPTPDIPATIAFASEETRVAREADNPLQGLSEVPQGGGMSLSAVDRRYLDGLGRPVWLTARSHLKLSEVFAGVPEKVLTGGNYHELQRVREDLRRAASLMEELGYQPRSLSPDVRDYGRYVEDMVRLAQDAERDADLMFSKVDLEREDYGSLGDAARDEINNIYYGVQDKLTRFEREMQRYGCSACGELYRGRDEDRR